MDVMESFRVFLGGGALAVGRAALVGMTTSGLMLALGFAGTLEAAAFLFLLLLVTSPRASRFRLCCVTASEAAVGLDGPGAEAVVEESAPAFVLARVVRGRPRSAFSSERCEARVVRLVCGRSSSAGFRRTENGGKTYRNIGAHRAGGDTIVM